MVLSFDATSAIKQLIENMPKELSASASAASQSCAAELSRAAEYLAKARQDIRRNVRTPILTSDIEGIMNLLTSLGDLLTLERVSIELNRPVSGPGLADECYDLLDKANNYLILSQHFYDGEVEAKRTERPSDEVRSEVAAVSAEASSLKTEIMRYLEKLEVAFR